uniref:Uncharacterized protein n=1 Tax=Heliothis virescens TaxID=7102 RepID=A0A2A4JK11_HELVI
MQAAAQGGLPVNSTFIPPANLLANSLALPEFDYPGFKDSSVPLPDVLQPPAAPAALTDATGQLSDLPSKLANLAPDTPNPADVAKTVAGSIPQPDPAKAVSGVTSAVSGFTGK